MEPSYLAMLIDEDDSVIAHWLHLGADGFRLDVADELPDSFIHRLHQRIHELKPDSLVIGEVWEDASNKISYGLRRTYFTKPELDTVMNYPFRTAILDFVSGSDDGTCLFQTVMALAEHYPAWALHTAMNSLSTHDTPRVLTVFGAESNWNLAIQRLKAAAFLQFTLPGSPCIFYGDEVGLIGAGDPDCRRCYPWDNPNPMLFTYYQSLSTLKQQQEALRCGTIHFEYAKNGVVLFHRSSGLESLACLINCSKQNIIIPDSVEFLFSTETETKYLPPYSCCYRC